MEPLVQWVTPTPLWATASEDPVQMQRPALLRFGSDAFMEELAALLNARPDGLAQQLARPESFRARPPGAPSDWAPDSTTLKLYQPIHGHFYLIAGSLVCRLTGLPDRVVESTTNERAAFVVRRLAGGSQPGERVEQAWLNPPGRPKGWLDVQPGRERMLATGEELVPLFPVVYSDRRQNRRRRLLVGLVPTSSRDSAQADSSGASLLASADPASADPRLDDADTRVIEPLRVLRAQPLNPPLGETPSQRAKREMATAAQERESSRFVLLDFADFLHLQLPRLWESIAAGARPDPTAPGYALYGLLESTPVDRQVAGAPNFVVALEQIWETRMTLFRDDPPVAPATWNLRHAGVAPDALREALGAALGPYRAPSRPPPAPALTGQVPKFDPRPTTQYVLRCVYQRPNCGPLQPDLVSEPSVPFSLASFFDFDAPTRPIRIPMPVDTSIAGLRKFNKNVAFAISDQFREQMSRATDLKKALDGNLASGDSFNLGLLCSFSLPIITICALIVLMIFVSLLNIVFWWMPFLRICLPINLRARR